MLTTGTYCVLVQAPISGQARSKAIGWVVGLVRNQSEAATVFLTLLLCCFVLPGLGKVASRPVAVHANFLATIAEGAQDVAIAVQDAVTTVGSTIEEAATNTQNAVTTAAAVAAAPAASSGGGGPIDALAGVFESILRVGVVVRACMPPDSIHAAPSVIFSGYLLPSTCCCMQLS